MRKVVKKEMMKDQREVGKESMGEAATMVNELNRSMPYMGAKINQWRSDRWTGSKKQAYHRVIPQLHLETLPRFGLRLTIEYSLY